MDRKVTQDTWRNSRCLLLVLLVGVLGAGGVSAQGKQRPAPEDLIQFEVAAVAGDPFAPVNQVGAPRHEFRRGEVFQLVVTGTPRTGYHTYPISQRTPGQSEKALSTIKHEESPGLVPLWPVLETPAKFVDTKTEDGYWLEYEGRFTWRQDVVVLSGATPGETTLRFQVRTQMCDERGCTWVEKKLQLALEISAEEALPLSPALQQRLKTDTKPPPVQVVQVPASLTKPAPPGPGATESGKPAPGKLAADTGFWALIFLSISAGFFSILTPCVLPVIPLTVSFFLKQAEQRKMRPLTMATVFSLTIVVVLTAGGLLFLEVLEAVIAHWGTNLFLGGLFIFFALSLFGMYEIGLPESLSQFTQSREERGGVIGTIFMALTFTIISFACIGPIYASCLALAATGSVTGWLKALAATLAYSISFAAPFFFLALFPGMLRSVPRSGSWMNTIKVVLGFLILAVSFTFLSGAEFKIYGKNAYLTYDLVLGILVALSLLCGFYLLGLYRLPHDEPMEHLGVPRLLCSLVFLSLGFYLLPGLFKSADGEKQRPAGALFDGISLLLPRPPVDEGSVALPSDGKSRPDGAPAGGRLRWIGNLQRGLDEAKQQQRLVFLDFTGFD